MFCQAPCIFLSILCAGLCVPDQSSNKPIFMVYIERRIGVSCSVYDMLHTGGKGYIIMCKLVKLAFCLCGGLIDPSNVGVAVGIRQLILQHPLNCKIYCRNMCHNIARFGVYRKKGYLNISGFRRCSGLHKSASMHYAVLCRPIFLHIPYLLKYFEELSLCVKH